MTLSNEIDDLVAALRVARDEFAEDDAPEMRVVLRNLLAGEIGLDLPEMFEVHQ